MSAWTPPTVSSLWSNVSRKHRIEIEKIALEGDQRRSWGGIIGGSVITVLFLALAGYLAYLGNVGWGVAIALTNIASLAGVFVFGTQSRKEERKGRMKDILGPLLPKSPVPEEQPDERTST